MVVTPNKKGKFRFLRSALDHNGERVLCWGSGKIDEKQRAGIRSPVGAGPRAICTKVSPPAPIIRIEPHGNCKAPPFARDETIRAIRRQGRRKWKRSSGYHRRSIVETHLGRYKRLIGRTLRATDRAPTDRGTSRLCGAQSPLSDRQTGVLSRRKKGLNPRGRGRI